MLPADIPDESRLLDLLDHRDPMSVSISLASSPLPAEHGRVKIAFRDAIDEAERAIAASQPEQDVLAQVIDPLRALIDDEEFWSRQSRSMMVLAAPERLEAFRIPFEIPDAVTVGDRFDPAPLLRTFTGHRRAFVLQLSQSTARLTEIGVDDHPVEHPLRLPEDHQLMLQHAENDGQSDRDRAQGALGDRIERERFCRVVQDEVVRIVPHGVPLILDSTDDLEPAYRAVNTHPDLVEESIAPHPDSQTDRTLAERARTILEHLNAQETSRWKERFGTLRAQGLATTRLAEVAAAAVAAGIDELRFDIEDETQGTIDEFGRLTKKRGTDAAGGGAGDGREPATGAERLVDEIAAQVLRTGGRVLAVRQKELLDGSPVAATLRFPVQAPH